MLPFFLIVASAYRKSGTNTLKKIQMDDQLIAYLETFITERRKELFNTVIKFRTRYITVVLEDIYQPHNASAILRSCDCFGIQNVHILENRNKYEVNSEIALGSDKWLNLFRYNYDKDTLKERISTLRSNRYRIVATTPHEPTTELGQFNLEKGPVALLFGTELEGLTAEIKNEADEFLKIPMFGFTESLNISVSAAIILQHLTNRLHQSNISWKLSTEEENEVKLNWLRKSVKNSEAIEKEFIAKNINNQKLRI